MSKSAIKIMELCELMQIFNRQSADIWLNYFLALEEASGHCPALGVTDQVYQVSWLPYKSQVVTVCCPNLFIFFSGKK